MKFQTARAQSMYKRDTEENSVNERWQNNSIIENCQRQSCRTDTTTPKQQPKHLPNKPE